MPGVGEVFLEGSPGLREGAPSFWATLHILVVKYRLFRIASSGLRAAVGFSDGILDTIEDDGMPPVENATPIEDGDLRPSRCREWVGFSVRARPDCAR